MGMCHVEATLGGLKGKSTQDLNFIMLKHFMIQAFDWRSPHDVKPIIILKIRSPLVGDWLLTLLLHDVTYNFYHTQAPRV